MSASTSVAKEDSSERSGFGLSAPSGDEEPGKCIIWFVYGGELSGHAWTGGMARSEPHSWRFRFSIGQILFNSLVGVGIGTRLFLIVYMVPPQMSRPPLQTHCPFALRALEDILRCEADSSNALPHMRQFPLHVVNVLLQS